MRPAVFCFSLLVAMLIATETKAQTDFLQTINRQDSSRAVMLRKYVTCLASDSFEGRQTATKGQKKAAAFLAAELASFDISPVCRDSSGQLTWFQSFSYAKRFGDSSKYLPGSENVIGYIPSAIPSDEYLVISAHYDHLGIKRGEIYNGADDNGSGVATVLCMAYELSANRSRLKRNILVIFFSGEEKGLLGSEYFSKNPAVPMNSIFADLNVDMIGRADSAHQADSNYIYVIGSDKISKPLDSLLVAVNRKYYGITLDYKYNDEKDPSRLYYRSDHYNFAKSGIPVIFFFSGLHKDYHKPTDDVEFINFTYLQIRAKLILAVAFELQQLERPLK